MRFEIRFVGHPEDRFSRDEARIIMERQNIEMSVVRNVKIRSIKTWEQQTSHAALS